MYLEQWQGWLVLAVLGILSLAVTLFWRRGVESKLSYLLGGRMVPWFPLACSIAATWLAAQVLFVTATQAYETGWVGVFWFTVPNVGSLILFAFIASHVRKRVPDGVTLSEAVSRRAGTTVQRVYQFILMAGQTLQFAVQLTAGGILLSSVTGMDYNLLVISIAAITVVYTVKKGIRATILTDMIQVVLTALVLGFLAVWFAVEAGDYIVAGLAGPNGEHTSLIAGHGAELFFTFGLVSGMGLLLGPFNDQSFWQRAWAGRPGHMRRAFIVGALLFMVAPLSVMLFGFAASGAGMDIDPETANLTGLTTWLPTWTAIPFSLAVMAGIFSTADSQLSAVASVVGHDLTKRDEHVVRNGRIAMIALAVTGLGIALIPGTAVLTLFTVFAAVRMTPTGVTAVAMLTDRVMSPRHVLIGLCAGVLIGVPFVALGTIYTSAGLTFTGTLLCLGAPAALALFTSRSDSPAPATAPIPEREKANLGE